MEETCLNYLGGENNIHSYIELLLRYQDDKVQYIAFPLSISSCQDVPQSLLTRLCFIMANLTVQETPQHEIFFDVIDDIVALFGLAAESFLESSEKQNDIEHVDFLVKVSFQVVSKLF